MAIFYTARHGLLTKGTKTLEAAMQNILPQDVIQINQRTIRLENTLRVKGDVTIEGDPQSAKRPVVVVNERILGFLVEANVQGTILFRHLDIQISDSSIAVRNNSKYTKLVFEDVQIYHHKTTHTPYIALVSQVQGNSELSLNNSVIDSANVMVADLAVMNTSLGDWFMLGSATNVDNPSLLAAHNLRIGHSSIQNTLLSGIGEQAIAQVQKVAFGGNVNVKNIHMTGHDVQLTQLPTINHRGKLTNVQDAGNESTSLVVDEKAIVSLKNVTQSESNKLSTSLPLPEWRLLGVIHGGTLSISDSSLYDATLKNAALEGTITFENVSDSSQWQVGEKLTVSSRNSSSMLFDRQSTMPAGGAMAASQQSQSHGTALEELNEMIGLTEVKQRVNHLIAQAKMSAERKRRGLDKGDSKMNAHMVFLGSPGTGKTEVARIVARALYEAGVTEANICKEVNVSDLTGKVLGESGDLTKSAINSALGGVLFLDEAYTLAPPATGGNTYINEIIDALMPYIENKSDRLIVIMAGYQQKMIDFFNRTNPGMKSRMTNFIKFPDYSLDELKQILVLKFKHSGAMFPRDQNIARQTLDSLFTGLDRLAPVISRDPTAGNGRFVRTYMNKILEMRDSRLAQSNVELSNDDLLIINTRDIDNAVNVMIQQANTMAN